MKVIVLCAWRMKPGDQFVDFVAPFNRVVEAYLAERREQFFIVGTDEQTTLNNPYSPERFYQRIKSEADEKNIVASIWNAKETDDHCAIRLSLNPPGTLDCSFVVDLDTDWNGLFRLQHLMLTAVDCFGGHGAKVGERATTASLDKIVQKKALLGRLGPVTYVQRPDIVEVEGFTARRHGDGVVYVMERSVAGKSPEERAEAIAKLQPLFGNEQAKEG